MIRPLKPLLNTCAGVLVAAAALGAPVSATPTPVEIVDFLLDSEPYASIFGALHRHFPAEAVELRGLLAEIVAPDGSATADADAAALHARLAQRLLGASDAEIVALLDTRLGMIRALADEPLACASFLSGGYFALSQTGLDLPPGMIGAAAEQLYATLAAQTVKPGTVRVSDADYTAMDAYLAQAGVSDQDQNSILIFDPQDANLCPAFDHAVSALRDADFDWARRVRTDVMMLLSGA